jgi:hypothetical protein
VKLSAISLLTASSLTLFSISARSQAVVENAIVTGAASTGAASAGQGISKSIGGILGNLDKALEQLKGGEPGKTAGERSQVVSKPASPASAPSTVVAVEAQPSPPEPLKAAPVGADQIKVGMSRLDLVGKVGKPFMKTSRVDGPQYVETYYYKGLDDMVVATLREGRVTSVSPPPGAEAPQKSAAR